VVATTYELGWHCERRLGVSTPAPDVYTTDVRDEHLLHRLDRHWGYFQNIGATRRSGVQLALQWRGASGVRAYANYGYTRATFETTATLATPRDTAGETVTPGDRLPMVPDHRVNAGLAVPILRSHGTETGVSLMAGLDARYVGRQWLRGDEENATRRLSDYTVADLSLTLSGATSSCAARCATCSTGASTRSAPSPRIPRRPARR